MVGRVTPCAPPPASKKTARRGLTRPTISTLLLACFILLHSSFCLRALGQSCSVDWCKISGGGGTSAGGPLSGVNYSVTGTIGQPDAGGAMTGGPVAGTNYYSVTGGFWSLISVVQMPGVPNLLIVPNGPDSVKILWPDAATNTYTLQQNANLALASGWAPSGYAITPANGTNSVTITPPTGNLFFRLMQ
jgi:hypothetical protein